MALRIGFIGANSPNKTLCDALRTLSGASEPVEIVAVADSDLSKSKIWAASCGASAFSSAPKMFGALEKGALDAVFVALEAAKRGAAENASIAHGAALYLVPPLGAHIRTSNALGLAVRKNGVLVGVHAPHRYASALDVARKIAASKTRKIAAFDARFTLAETENLWLGAWPLFDVLRVLGGEPKRIFGLGGAGETAPAGAALCELRSGALASVCVERGVKSAGEIRFSRGDAQFRLQFDSRRVTFEQREGETQTVWRSEDLVEAQLRAFVNALVHGRRAELRPQLSEAAKTQKWALAAQRAASGGKWVEI